MKIAILHGPRDLRIEDQELDVSELGPHQVHVETEISALKIGTDRGNYEGAEQVPGAPDYPRWVGDSNLGIVRALGSEVSRLSVGDRVVSRAPHCSDYLAEDTEHLVRVPDNVDSEDAVWAHLYTLSAHCYRKAQFTPGENVAVVGLGVLGLGAVALGPFFGARVIAIGNHPHRLELAAKMGAETGFLYDDPELLTKIDDATGGLGVDLVIQTANPWPALRTACQIVRNNGRVSIVALSGRGEPPLDFNPLDMKWFYNKGISLIAVSQSGGYLYPTEGDRFDSITACEHTLSLMARGLEPKRLITHRLPYTRMAEVYEMIYAREKNMLGVIFQWQGMN
ncbi:MAG: zinc-binding dehydrogenase [Candidatus Latescibacterota bacterium]|nr:zinc-binding dehydrogenase [Candidatus Latescibacterota bacterium]